MSADNNSTLEHFVSERPFDPLSVERLTPEQEAVYLGVPDQADVVEVQKAQDGGGFRHLPVAFISVDTDLRMVGTL